MTEIIQQFDMTDAFYRSLTYNVVPVVICYWSIVCLYPFTYMPQHQSPDNIKEVDEPAIFWMSSTK